MYARPTCRTILLLNTLIRKWLSSEYTGLCKEHMKDIVTHTSNTIDSRVANPRFTITNSRESFDSQTPRWQIHPGSEKWAEIRTGHCRPPKQHCSGPISRTTRLPQLLAVPEEQQEKNQGPAGELTRQHAWAWAASEACVPEINVPQLWCRPGFRRSRWVLRQDTDEK